MARIGIFGGTFNPVHRGHLAVARQLRREFPLERVYLVPSHVPPHKDDRGLAAAAHRLAMIELALADAQAEGLLVSDVELRRRGPSYTVDTVASFRRQLAPQDRLFLIMGADAFLELDFWRQWRALLAEVSLIVMSRPAEDGTSGDWQALAAYARERLDEAYRLESAPWRLSHPRHPTVYFAAVADDAVSSSQIRRRLQRGAGIEGLVPGAVAAYIASKGLYR